jgi:hypothetical protein
MNSMSSSRFEDDIKELQTAIDERPALEVEEGPKTRSRREVWWLIAVLVGLMIGAAEVAILAGAGASREATAAPQEIVRAIASNYCFERMRAIGDALGSYRDKTGEFPRALADLRPDHVAFAPTDPSGAPYGYAVRDGSFSLTCPNPRLHAPSEQLAQSLRSLVEQTAR